MEEKNEEHLLDVISLSEGEMISVRPVDIQVDLFDVFTDKSGTKEKLMIDVLKDWKLQFYYYFLNVR